MNFGDLITKGNNGDVLLLRFPHREAKERTERKEHIGRELGPNCLFRFLPHIATLSIGTQKIWSISDLGDVLRPKQFVQHKYQTYKSTYSYEELLENLRVAIKDNMTAEKELIFFGSTSETFPTIFSQIEQLNSTKKKTILFFSPYLNLQYHYNETNIRVESSMRWLVDHLRFGADINVHYIGANSKYIHKEELEFINDHKDIIKVSYIESLSKSSVLDLLNEIKHNEDELYVNLSFDIVSSEYFEGKNFDTWDDVFDNYLMLDIIRLLARYDNLKVLAFYDFNPKIEDYRSGVFYATLVYEFLKNRCKFTITEN